MSLFKYPCSLLVSRLKPCLLCVHTGISVMRKVKEQYQAALVSSVNDFRINISICDISSYMSEVLIGKTGILLRPNYNII